MPTRCLLLAPTILVAFALAWPVWAAPPADPLAATGTSPWTSDKAAHLLRRAGFSGPPEEIRRLTQMGRDQAVDFLIDYEKTAQTCADFPADRLVYEPPRGQFAGLQPEERMRLFNAVRRLGAGNLAALQDWWLQRMVETPRPLEEKMTLFWHGHFTSGFREVRRPDALYRQNEFLRRHALGDFRTLLQGISRDPAMLAYLDNGKNVKSRPNENYARELMELFTMGEGHYTEADVKEAARAFTGWSATREGEFVVRAREHDNGTKTFLGQTGNFDGDDIIHIILEQPATAKFMARKLCRFFVSPDPDPALVDTVADDLVSTDYDFRETLRTLFRSDAFYHPKYRSVLIKSPAELIASAAREFDIPLADLRAANQAMNQMGQELFQPPNVKGWDGGRAWITTSTLFLRYNIMKAALDGTLKRTRPGAGPPLRSEKDPDDTGPAPRRRNARAGDEAPAMAERDNAMEMAMRSGPLQAMQKDLEELPDSAREYLLNLKLPPQYSKPQPPYDPARTLEKYRLRTAADVVDHYLWRLLNTRLTSDRRQILIDALEPEGARFDIKAPDAPARIRKMIHLIVSTPEYQLN